MLVLASMAATASGEDVKAVAPTIVDLAASTGTVAQTTSEEFRQRVLVQLDAVKPKASLKIDGPPLLGPDRRLHECDAERADQPQLHVVARLYACMAAVVQDDVAAVGEAFGEFIERLAALPEHALTS